MTLVGYLLLAFYTLGVLWLVVLGISSIFTRNWKIWIAHKTITLSGPLAVLCGVATALLGVFFLWFVLVKSGAFGRLEL